MTKLYAKPGDALDYTNNTANPIAVDSVVAVHSLIGVAAANIAVGATGTIVATGVFTLPKKAGTAAPVGTKLFWSVADKAFEVGAGASGDVANCAIVVELDAAAGDTTVRAFIDAGMGTVVP